MEPKKLKKLVLKKDVVAKLENHELVNLRGGDYPSNTTCTMFETCMPGRNCLTSGYGNENTQASCENRESCVPRVCPNPETNEVTICPTIGVGGCQTNYYC